MMHSAEILSQENLPISIDIFTPDSVKHSSVVLFLHGFKGAKDWGPFPVACQAICDQGFAVCAFNLSHSGVSQSVDFFDRLDLFATQTFGKDHSDIRSVIDSVTSHSLPGSQHWNTKKIAIVGHSKGGYSSVIAAADFSEIGVLITWAGVDDYLNRWSPKHVSDWETEGVTYIENGRTKQKMPLFRAIQDELQAAPQQWRAISKVAHLHKPALFIHGDNDESVSPSSSFNLFNAYADVRKKIVLIPGAGHTFSGSHPWKEQQLPTHLKHCVQESISFLKDYL